MEFGAAPVVSAANELADFGCHAQLGLISQRSKLVDIRHNFTRSADASLSGNRTAPPMASCLLTRIFSPGDAGLTAGLPVVLPVLERHREDAVAGNVFGAGSATTDRRATISA